MSNENKENYNLDESNVSDELNITENQAAVEAEQAELSEKSVKKQPKEKKKIQISISLEKLILSAVAACLVVFMLAFTLATAIAKKNYADGFSQGHQFGGGMSGSYTSEKDLINKLLEENFLGNFDEDALAEQSLKAYMEATGDLYAAYYSAEELAALKNEKVGKTYGVGINIINSTVVIGDTPYMALKITNIMRNSPASNSELNIGDLIAYVGIGENRKSIDALGGYDKALAALKGDEGTVAEFTVLRKDGDSYKAIEITLTRREVISTSVYASVLNADLGQKIGIIKIDQFDLTTPTQFEAAVTELKSKGCDKFVIDLRYNPGGDLVSVRAVLSYFLSEGDVYIRTEDKNGNIESQKIAPVVYNDKDYEGCNIDRADIGKYKDLNAVLLCNEYTASAGELFVATFMDYELGEVVGVKTYGKGTMQNTFTLVTGAAVKFTTHYYYSAKSPSYNGTGITPDYELALSGEAKKYNVYDLPQNLDNQLLEAIKYFK